MPFLVAVAMIGGEGATAGWPGGVRSAGAGEARTGIEILGRYGDGASALARPVGPRHDSDGSLPQEAARRLEPGPAAIRSERGLVPVGPGPVGLVAVGPGPAVAPVVWSADRVINVTPIEAPGNADAALDGAPILDLIERRHAAGQVVAAYQRLEMPSAGSRFDLRI